MIIDAKTLTDAMYNAMRRAAVEMPPDVRQALEKAWKEEKDPTAKMHLELSLKNADLALAGEGLVCADTGFPLFFINVGDGTVIEGGLRSLYTAADGATRRATRECYLRPTMVDPLRRSNPGDNTGPGMPSVKIEFSAAPQTLEITAAPKGGGSEIFGTFYRMLFPSDGLTGVKKFALNCIKDSCYAGKICPPAIVGIGIGGTADTCMSMAKKAALLRKIGQEHSDPLAAELERDLLSASRRLGIGPMGSKGINAVIAVNVETAFTHTAALPVAFNAQCLVGRRWKAIITEDQQIHYTGEAE